ncbi:MAG: bifunctional diguanylate cyclase/phosphodiesterase [Chromatiaceae bacterium]|nr:bifunctional diguanylate cyclase/phosphodiesterase [Candidatus Thioaporhodococcus sediminis]
MRNETTALRLMRLTFAIAVPLALIFASALFWRTPDVYLPWIDGVAYTGVILLGALTVVPRALLGGPLGTGWALLATGMILYASGEVWWALVGRTRSEAEAVGLPLEDVLWLAFYPVQVLALWRLMGKVPRRDRNLLDALVVSGGLLVVLAVLIQDWLPGANASGGEDSLIVEGLYVTGDLVLVVLAILLVYVQRFDVAPGWWLIAAGFLAFALADILYWILSSYDAYVEGTWLDLGWLVSALCLAGAAILGLETMHAPQVQSLRGIVPASLAVMVSGLALGWGPEGPFGDFARYAALATLVLSLLRLNVAIRDAAEAQEQRRRAFTDDLTGLPNRHALHALPELSGKSLASPTGWSLIVLGLDRFGDVNASLSHERGDRLLTMTAERLGGCLLPGDVLARLEGDEFAVLMRLSDPSQGFAGAERLQAALEKPFEIDGVPVPLTACMGLSATLDPVPAIGPLLKEANLAMHYAKREGPGLIRAYSGQEAPSSVQRLRMRASLRSDLKAGGAAFELHYQPIVRIDNGALLAMEALVRWRQDGALVPPGQFLGEIEHAGLMVPLTQLVLNRAVAAIHRLGQGHAVTVNVSPDLVTPWLLDQVRDTLDRSGAPPHSLIVEVTEDALIRKPDTANEVLRALRVLGVRVLLDDFGAGWCGLSAVRDLAVDGLKIDRAFVARIHRDRPTRAITASIVDLGRSLGLTVIGEGVEDAGEREELEALGVEWVQGYAYNKPIPEADLAAYLSQHPPT